MSYKSYSNLGKDPNAQQQEQDLSSFNIPYIRNKQERDSVIGRNRIVVIDNYADWCGPCQHVAPMFAKLASNYNRPGVCVFYKENVDNKIPGAPPLNGVPCFHFYVNGNFRPDLTVMGVDMDQMVKTLTQELTAQFSQNERK